MSFWDQQKSKDQGTPYDFERVPLDGRRAAAAIQQKQLFQRTRDVASPRLLTLATAVDGTAGSWNLVSCTQRPSVLQLLLNGLPTAHAVYVTNTQPDDTTQPSGNFLSNALGTAYMLQTGEYWVYIPNVAGDAATFKAILFDASSELPAQLAALISGGNGTSVNLASIGGTTQSGVDVASKYLPITWGSTSAVVGYSAADAAAIPANAARRALSIFNEDAAATVALGIGTRTRLAGVYVIPPLTNIVIGSGTPDCCSQQAFRSWGTAAGNLSYTEGT